MIMKKKIMVAILGLISLFSIGCTSGEGKQEGANQEEIQQEEVATINLGVPKAAPTLPILQMQETNAMGDEVKLNIEYWNSPEQLIAMTQDDKYDIFAMPLTVGATLYNKGVDLKLTNVNTWGIAYFVTSDDSIKEWKDLQGKTIYVPQKSSPADILTQYFLESNGLKIGEDVELKYSTPSEISQLLKSGEIDYGVLLEPQATNAITNSDTLKILFSYNDEWKSIMGEDKEVPNAGIGVTTAFAEENEELLEKFETEYEKALNYLLENPEVAGELGEKYLQLDKDIVIASMPRLGLMYKDAQSSTENLKEFYELLYNFDESTIGGKIPSEDFYYGSK